MDIEKIMARLPSNKGKRRNPNRVRGRYRKKQRTLTDSDLVRHLVSFGIHTTGQLKKSHQCGHPTLYDYIKRFTSWREAQTAAYGPQLTSTSTAPTQSFSPDYLVKCVLEFNLNTRKSWCDAHRKEPSVIPSLYHVRKLFLGSFQNLTAIASRHSIRGTVDACLVLTQKLGRTPTLRDYRQHGVDLGCLYDNNFVEGKRELDRLLKSLNRKKSGGS